MLLKSDVQFDTMEGSKEIASRAASSRKFEDEGSPLVKAMRVCRYSNLTVLMPSDISYS